MDPSSPRPSLPTPTTPVARSTSFNFDHQGSGGEQKTPKKGQLQRSSSFLSKFSEQKRRIEKEKRAIDEIQSEAQRIRGGNEVEKGFEDHFCDDYHLKEGEKRCYLSPKSLQEPTFQDVLNVCREWINELLSDEFITITSMTEDFYDGIVLARILGQLSGEQIRLPLGEDVQAKERQLKNLTAVLNKITDVLALQPASSAIT